MRFVYLHFFTQLWEVNCSDIVEQSKKIYNPNQLTQRPRVSWYCAAHSNMGNNVSL